MIHLMFGAIVRKSKNKRCFFIFVLELSPLSLPLSLSHTHKKTYNQYQQDSGGAIGTVEEEDVDGIRIGTAD